MSLPTVFALHPFDAGIQAYRAPYRMYSPSMARWTTSDPAGMADGPNMYAYVKGMPTSSGDEMGLWECGPHGDYSDFDRQYNPLNPLYTHYHFRSMKTVQPHLIDAIADCDFIAFENFMHQGQDTFSHYNKGYRWWTFGHLYDSLTDHSPDDVDADSLTYWDMKKWTKQMERYWKANCSEIRYGPTL